MATWNELSSRWSNPQASAIYAEDVDLSFAELTERVERASGWLADRGVVAGDRVALMIPRSLAFLELFLGALRIGAVALPLNDRYTASEVGFLLADAEPRLAVLVDDLAAEHGAIRASTLRSALDEAPRVPAPTVAADAPAVLCYTSGTTGRPKGAILLHRNVMATIAALHKARGWTERDVLVHALPLNHVHGLFVAQLGALWAGARTVWVPRFEPALVWEAIERHRATIFMGVPTFYTRLLTAGGTPDLASVRLFTSGSAPLPAHIFAGFDARFRHRILERYGMTEVGIVLSNPLDGERKPGSIGLPLPGVELRVTDPRGVDVAAGEIGELRIRGPSVFASYLGQKEATEAAIGDGWMHTGDLGRRDADGYVFLTGRASELVLVGGLNVYPREIEAVLLDHPDVVDAAVVGVDDDDLGEVPCAAIVLRPGVEALSSDQIRAFARERLAPYKVPKRVLEVPALPRNAMGKTLKNQIRRWFLPITVRRAHAHEAARIAASNCAMALETEDLTLDPDVVRAGVEAVFSRGVGAFYLISELGGEPVGQLMITTEWSDWRNAVVWWIQSVYVEPESRGAGVFRALYEETARLAAEAGAAGIRLYVDRRNTRAAEVYRRLGMNGDHYLVFERMT
jgi:malonyl-CoA/methylmalonyl-CoA synthetase